MVFSQQPALTQNTTPSLPPLSLGPVSPSHHTAASGVGVAKRLQGLEISLLLLEAKGGLQGSD